MAALGRLLRFLVVIYSLLEQTELPTADVAKKRCKESTSWNFFVFVQESPSATCILKSGNSCCDFPPNMTALTIHGLWPATTNPKCYPQHCKKSQPFSETAVRTLVPRLVQEWTNVYPKKGNFFKFWKHEWEKHGTCVTGIPSMSNQHDYFETTLFWFEAKYNYGRVLENYGIVPSNTRTYSVKQFNNAFLDTYGVKPLLECQSKHGIHILKQIWLCLQKDFQVMKCPGSYFKKKRHILCQKEKPIHFVPPPTVNEEIHCPED